METYYPKNTQYQELVMCLRLIPSSSPKYSDHLSDI